MPDEPGAPRLDPSKYTSKVLQNKESNYNRLAPKASVPPETGPSAGLALPPTGHTPNAKGERQLMAYFDYQQWSGTATQEQQQQPPPKLTAREIQEIKRKKDGLKRKHKNGWLYT